MAKCMYYKCTKTSKDNVSLFQFPTRYPDCLREWIENSGNASLISLSTEVLKKRFICSDHFRPDQIHNGQIRKRLIGLATPKPYYLSKRAGMAAAPFDPEKVQTTYNRSKQASPRLSPNAVPSQFSWNQQKEDGKKEIKEEGPVWEVSLDCSETKRAIQYAAEVKTKQLSNCRCCLSFGEHVKLEKDHNATLLKLSIFLQDDSRLPDRICQVCITNLTRFSEFRSMVIETQKRLVGAVTGGVKLQPRGSSSPAPTPDPLAFPEVEIKVERPDDDDDDEANDDDEDNDEDTDDAYTEASFDQNEDMEDRKDMVFKDGLLPALDDTTQNTPDPLEVNSPTVTSEVQPKLQKILVQIPNQKNLPVMAPGQAPKRLRLITPDMATKLGLIPVPSTSMSPSEPALQLRGNMQQNVRVIRLPRAVQQMMAKQTHAQGIRAIAPTSNVRLAVDEADASKQTQICVKSEPEASAATTSTHSADPDTSETDDAEDINPGEDDSKERQSSDTTEEGAKKRAASQFLKIGIAGHQFFLKKLLRDDIIQIVQNSTIIPFTPYNNYSSYKCLYCPVKENDYPTFKRHYTKEHNVDLVDSDVYKALRARFFDQYCLVHADVTDVKCKICAEPFVDITALAEHLKFEHDKVFNTVKGEKCEYPPYGILCFRLETEPFECVVCSKQFNLFIQLHTHMNEHYSTFQCQDCDKKFFSYSALFAHMKSHEKKASIKCKDCGKLFLYLTDKRSHQFNVIEHKNGEKSTQMKCCYCPALFETRVLKKEHVDKKHATKKPKLTCPVCHKVYTNKGALRSHNKRWHMPRQQCICDMCGFTTYDKRFLAQHIESHSGIRKFECEICRKKFRSKGTLAVHMKGHNNDKRFACSLCDAAFIQKHCLKSHVKSKHPESGVDIN